MSYPAPNGYEWKLLPVQHHGFLNKTRTVGGIVYDESHNYPIYTYGWILIKNLAPQADEVQQLTLNQ